MKRVRLCDHSGKDDECLRDSTFDLAKSKEKLKRLTPKGDANGSKIPEYSGFQSSTDGMKSFSGFQGGNDSVKSFSGFQASEHGSPQRAASVKSFSVEQFWRSEKIPVSGDSDLIESDQEKEGDFLLFKKLLTT